MKLSRARAVELVELGAERAEHRARAAKESPGTVVTVIGRQVTVNLDIDDDPTTVVYVSNLLPGYTPVQGDRVMVRNDPPRGVAVTGLISTP